MKKIYTLILICFTLIARADFWTQKADFPGLNRDASFGFSIGAKGYVGCGRDSGLYSTRNFWEYDQLTNAWTQKADFAGGARYSATGFAVFDKGYVCFGNDSLGNYKDDIWQYDPMVNSWIQKTSIPAAGRVQAVCFIIQNKAYLCCGLSTNYLNELWEYDPATDSWLQKTSFPGAARISPIVFSMNNKGYVGAGYYYSGSYNNPLDFYEYDAIGNSWLQKADFGGPGRTQGANFALSNNGYAGAGDDGYAYYNDFWQYNPVTDIWTQKTNVPGMPRDECISFSIGGKGYAGLGESAAFFFPHDLWEYTPDSTTGINEFTTYNLQFTVAPNPAKEFLVITSDFTAKEKIEIIITNVQGKKVFEAQIETKTLNYKLQTSNYPNGLYFVEINNGKEKTVKKFIKN